MGLWMFMEYVMDVWNDMDCIGDIGVPKTLALTFQEGPPAGECRGRGKTSWSMTPTIQA